MKDPILQAVRDARASVAEDFDFDLHKFFAWAKTHAAAESKAKQWLPTSPNKTLEPTGGASKPPVSQLRRSISSRTKKRPA
jgi:hypothetical protein